MAYGRSCGSIMSISYLSQNVTERDIDIKFLEDSPLQTSKLKGLSPNLLTSANAAIVLDKQYGIRDNQK